MSIQAGIPTSKRSKPGMRIILASVAAVVVIAAMALDTKIVKIGVDTADSGVFAPETYGQTAFPKIQSAIVAKAVDAGTLASALAADKAGAIKQYGVPGGIGPEISVKFTGVVGQGKSGVYVVTVQGVPSTLMIRVQTGPAINGTDLRDATGTIKFQQFTNQIDYQNAGSALNNELKKQVLSKIDNSNLTGKTISVVGAFQLINPNSWLVTPVKLDVQ